MKRKAALNSNAVPSNHAEIFTKVRSDRIQMNYNIRDVSVFHHLRWDPKVRKGGHFGLELRVRQFNEAKIINIFVQITAFSCLGPLHALAFSPDAPRTQQNQMFSLLHWLHTSLQQTPDLSIPCREATSSSLTTSLT